MCLLQISMQCYDKFLEIALDEKENAELFVEDMVSHVLLRLFGEGTVHDVTIQFSSHLPMGLHHCFISIYAECSCEEFVLFPHSQEHMKRAIEDSISSIFKELSVKVQFDTIELRPSQEVCNHEAERSHNVPTQLM